MLTALGLRLRLRVLLALAVSAGVCFAATPAVGRLARRIGAMDRPGESRRVHDHPIPRLGGLAILLGLLAGIAAFRVGIVRELLSPLLTMMKTVPVASFIILILVWFGSEKLAVIVALLIVFPQIYFATLAGLESTDRELLELSRVFRVPGRRVAWQVYRPALWPYLRGACASALGMSWKAGIAAEVIGTPLHSIGEQMYLAKIYMDTSELFAWTLTVICLSAVFEKAMLWLLGKAGK